MTLSLLEEIALADNLNEQEFDELVERILARSGIFDKDGRQIFEGDKIEDEKGKEYSVEYIAGAFWACNNGNTTSLYPFNNNCTITSFN